MFKKGGSDEGGINRWCLHVFIFVSEILNTLKRNLRLKERQQNFRENKTAAQERKVLT